jgi:cytochrome c biogenesis factor
VNLVRLHPAILFAGLVLSAVGFAMSCVVAISGRDDGKGAKSFRWFAAGLIGLGVVVVAFSLILDGGLRH